MTRTWLIVDVNNLAHRAMHATGQLQYGEERTGVIFGVLREIFALQDRFQTYSTVLAFDHGKGIRETTFVWYKETRRKRKLTDEQEEQYRDMREQTKRLRTDIFPRLGYSNILWQDGYEADDIIASVVHGLGDKDEAVIVSGDKDLYQLLSDTVGVYHPISGKLVTRKSFRKEWGIGPGLWPSVKALAGCSTDDVPGAEGVGDKTAAKYFGGGIPKTHKVYRTIREFVRRGDYARNLELVTLPYPGTKSLKLVPDNLDLEAREEILSELGITSFR